MGQRPALGLEARGLSKHIAGRPVVIDVELAVAPGTVYYLVGNNGAGKTTLLRLLGGLLRPTSGRVSVSGVPIWNVPGGALPRLGLVPADGGYYPNLTVRQNVHLALTTGAGNDPTAEADTLDLLALRDLKDRRASTLSKGQKKRLAMACVLVRRPEVLLLDEPFADLDETAIALVQGMVTIIRARADTAVTIGTVLPPDSDGEAALVGILSHGRLVQERAFASGVNQGPIREMLRDAARTQEAT